MNIMGILQVAAAGAVLAIVIESCLEYVFGIWWKPFPPEKRPNVLMAMGLVLGILLCLKYRVDLLASVGFAASRVGQVLTGALVGRGTDVYHAILEKIKAVAGGSSPTPPPSP